ncbi:MAG: hypothetical protein ACO1N1_02345 [Dyadobacter fermentans]
MNYFRTLPWRLVAPALLFALTNCASDDPAEQNRACDCNGAIADEAIKDKEAVVVLLEGNNPDGYQGPDMYILSTDPADFERTSHAAGPNILVPCVTSLSVPEEYQKQGLRVLVSYRRKQCYGAITSPVMRSNYGYFVHLINIQRMP